MARRRKIRRRRLPGWITTNGASATSSMEPGLLLLPGNISIRLTRRPARSLPELLRGQRLMLTLRSARRGLRFPSGRLLLLTRELGIYTRWRDRYKSILDV